MRIKALLVDDDSNLASTMKRRIYSLDKLWEIDSVSVPEDSLKLLNEKKYDVIISDLMMPGLDGCRLLQKVKETHPDVLRIILSGSLDVEQVISSTKVAYYFFSKPYEIEMLKARIEDIVSFRQLLPAKYLHSINSAIESLPIAPALYGKLEKEANSNIISLRSITDLIEQDPVLTSKILRVVNSAFYNLSKTIDNSFAAVQFLGIETVKSIIIFLKLFTTDHLNEASIEIINQIYKHSFAVAKLAKKIAQIEKYDKETQSMVFTIGLLHDIGKLVFVQIPEYRQRLNAMNNKKDRDEILMETELFNLTHSDMSAYLLKLWGMNNDIINSVKEHHTPAMSDSDKLSINDIIYISNHFIKTNEIPECYKLLPGLSQRIEIIFQELQVN